MELELLLWGDETIRLSFWDSLEGKDRVFLLGGDGLAYIEGDDGTLELVNLVNELRGMVSDEH